MSDDARFRRIFRLSEHRPDIARDVEDELSFYLAMRERELIAEGVAPEVARRRALEAFGDRSAIAAEVARLRGARVRRVRVRELIGSLAQDVRYGARTLVRAPAFAVAAVLTLALGIGANALVFSLIEAMLLRAPAVRSPQTLVAVYTTCRRGDLRCSSSYPDYESYRDRTRAFADVAAYDHARLVLGDAGGAQQVTAALATGNYFELLGVSAARGRVLRPSDDVPGGDHAVVVLSDALWRGGFGGDPDVLGRTVRLNGVAHTVVGVAPPSFTSVRLGVVPDVWVPMHGLPVLFPGAFDPAAFDEREDRWISGLVARLTAGTTVARARAELLAVSAQLAAEDRDARGPRSVTVDPAHRFLLPVGGEAVIVQFAAVLQAVVVLTLLLACANLANLLLARASARRRELGVRIAIGAGRRRIVRQLVTESAVLATAGAMAGLLLAAVGLNLISAFELPFGFTLSAVDAAINPRVIGFTAAVALGTLAVFATLPALHASRGELATVLRESRTGGGPRGGRVLSALVGVQIALCVVLLAGAGLFLRTLGNQLRRDLGFPTGGIAMVTVDPSMSGYTADRAAALIREMTARAAALPGVVAATAGMRVPVTPGGSGTFVRVEGYVPAPDEEMRVEFNFVAPDYFRALGLAILRGRAISEEDVAGARRVIVIDEEMAEAWWPGRDPLGGTVLFYDMPHVVVGIARSNAWSGLDVGGSPFLFAPVLQNPERIASGPPLTFVARTAPGREDALLPLLAGALRDIDPELPPTSLQTMDAAVATTLAPQRAAAALLSVFGLVALVLAAVGIYGVVAYGVAQRRRDFGIRMALGARGGQLMTHVARGMSAPLVLGAVAGLAAAVALGRAVQGLMFGVAPTDPLTLGATLAILALAAAAATLIPARRAARTDPLQAIRSE